MVPFGLSTVVALRRLGTAAATAWPARGYWSVVTFSCPLRRRRSASVVTEIADGHTSSVPAPTSSTGPRIRSAGISRNGSSRPCSVHAGPVPTRPGFTTELGTYAMTLWTSRG
jgi:hypothetical protein